MSQIYFKIWVQKKRKMCKFIFNSRKNLRICSVSYSLHTNKYIWSKGKGVYRRGGGQESVPHRNLLKGDVAPLELRTYTFQILNSRVKDKRRLKKQKIGICIFRCPIWDHWSWFHYLVTANINIQMLILININA